MKRVYHGCQQKHVKTLCLTYVRQDICNGLKNQMHTSGMQENTSVILDSTLALTLYFVILYYDSRAKSNIFQKPIKKHEIKILICKTLPTIRILIWNVIKQIRIKYHNKRTVDAINLIFMRSTG